MKKTGEPSARDLFIESFRDWETLHQALRAFQPNVIPEWEAILTEQNRAVEWLIERRVQALGDRAYWRESAANPKVFRRELQKRLHEIEDLLGWQYGQPAQAHRRRVHDDRDREIFNLREQGKSFGKIKGRLKLTSEQSARQAYERYLERQGRILGEFFDFASVLGSQNPEDKERAVMKWLEFARRESLISPHES
jgi:hypothetical protein